MEYHSDHPTFKNQFVLNPYFKHIFQSDAPHSIPFISFKVQFSVIVLTQIQIAGRCFMKMLTCTTSGVLWFHQKLYKNKLLYFEQLVLLYILHISHE